MGKKLLSNVVTANDVINKVTKSKKVLLFLRFTLRNYDLVEWNLLIVNVENIDFL